jgi:hypothetical protein
MSQGTTTTKGDEAKKGGKTKKRQNKRTLKQGSTKAKGRQNKKLTKQKNIEARK